MATTKNVIKVTKKTTRKVIKVTKHDVGRYVRIAFLDTGAVDGVITDVEGPEYFDMLPFNDLENGIINNNAAPVLVLGPHITAEHSGLLG